MSESTIAIIVPAIVSALAVISPIFTVLITKHLELKKLKVEAIYRDKLKIYEDFMLSYASFSNEKSEENRNSLILALHRAYLISESKARKMIHLAISKLRRGDTEDVDNFIFRCMEHFADDVQSKN